MISKIEYTETLVKQLTKAKCNICGLSNVYEDFKISLEKILLLTKIDEIEKSIDELNLRESIVCESCGSISRDRGLIFGLMYAFKESRPISEWEKKPQVRVFETAAYRGHPKYLNKLFDYFPTQFDPKKIKQPQFDGKKYADIQQMPYPDNFFDIVMSSDVLEHVRSHVDAINEVYRVIKDDGFFILQVPYVHSWNESSIRVYPFGETDVYLYPPQYHAEDTLVYRIFGRDLLGLLKQVGFSVAYLELDLINLGITPQSLIVCKKGDFLDINGFIHLFETFRTTGR